MLINRNVSAGDRRTSIRLEPTFWAALDDICRREKMTQAQAIERAHRDPEVGRTESVRVFVLDYFRTRVR